MKPKARPSWMTEAEFEELPATIEVRELQSTLPHRAYRTRLVTLTTTLLDAASYPADAPADLYGSQWRVDVALRNPRIMMRMDQSKFNTEDGVLKELPAHAMAYNLVCLTRLASATRRRVG